MPGRFATARLHRNAALERAIAEDPYDEERWIVLEDWLLERGDPRGVLIRLEKAGRAHGAARARRHLHPQLFGKRHEEIARSVYAGNWRAGYLRELHYAAGALEPLAALVTARATRLCRALTLTVPGTQRLDAALAHLRRGLAHVLSDLTISSPHDVPAQVAPHRLAKLPRLRRLQLRGAYFDRAAELPQVTTLLIAPTRYDHDRVAPLFAAMRLPDVREVVLDLANLGSLQAVTVHTPDTLAPVLARRCAPSIERFAIRNAPEPLPAETLAALAESGLSRPEG